MNHLTTHKHRESSYLRAYKAPSTTVEDSLQIGPFMQNEPNFGKAQMNVNVFPTKDYENKFNGTLGENEPKTNPIKANQSQSKPIKANKMPKQTQYEPKQNQFLSAISVAGQCSIMINCAICSANTSTSPDKFRESADTYYDVKNTLVKCCEMAMIVHSVAYTTFRPKGNSNSRSKCVFEVETIQFGGKPS